MRRAKVLITALVPKSRADDIEAMLRDSDPHSVQAVDPEALKAPEVAARHANIGAQTISKALRS